MQRYANWKLLWTLSKSGHLGEAVAAACVSPRGHGRPCQTRVELIQLPSMDRKFDVDKLTDSTLQLFLLPLHLKL